MIGIAHGDRTPFAYKLFCKISQSMLIFPRKYPRIVFDKSVIPMGDSIGWIEIDGISGSSISYCDGKVSETNCCLLQLGAYPSQVLLIKNGKMRFVAVWNIELALLVLSVDSIKREASQIKHSGRPV